jgi:dTDP-4-amino-4,6-dideoxy-D-galactose acyltransferase
MTEIESLVRFLPWDSEFFGRRIARVLPNTLGTEDIYNLDAWCAQEQIDCLYFLSSETGGSSLWPAQNNDFRLIDLRVTLSINLKKINLPAGQGLQISLASLEDIPALRAIATQNHTASRFYADPHFERSKCDELYQIWIENSVRDPNYEVITFKPEGRALGYVTSYINADGIGVIGLVGIAPQCQGRGIGTELINHSLLALQGKGVTQIEVVTQGRNPKAIQIYEKCGFRLKSIQPWFHKWYN